MAKFDIPFTYSRGGSITVEAENEEQAEAKALERLKEIRDEGTIDDYHEEVEWTESDLTV